MELLTPGPSIIICQIFCLGTIVLFVIALTLILTSKRMDPRRKALWFPGIMSLPVLGPMLLFVAFKRGDRAEDAENR